MIAMPRQPWTPETATETQLRLHKAVAAAAKKADAAIRRAEADLMAAVAAAHEAGVPMEALAEQTGRGRATLFRHAKPKKPDRP